VSSRHGHHAVDESCRNVRTPPTSNSDEALAVPNDEGADLFGCKAVDVAETIGRKSLACATSGFRLEWINIPTTIPCPNHDTGIWNEARNRVWQKEEPFIENLHSRV
jgi:hypothetical protein